VLAVAELLAIAEVHTARFNFRLVCFVEVKGFIVVVVHLGPHVCHRVQIHVVRIVFGLFRLATQVGHIAHVGLQNFAWAAWIILTLTLKFLDVVAIDL